MEGRRLAAYNDLLTRMQRAAAQSLRVYRQEPTSENKEVLLSIATALRTTTHVRGRRIRHVTSEAA